MMYDRCIALIESPALRQAKYKCVFSRKAIPRSMVFKSFLLFLQLFLLKTIR